jgi:hypothetical protein
MWHKETFGIWSDLVHNTVVFSQDKLELIVVHFEFVFLEEDNLGTFWDINSNSGQAFSFSDQGKDF